MSSDLNMEESALKTIKKELKEIFAKIEEDKESFDSLKDNLKKHRLAQTSEKMISSADEMIRKYEFQLQMLRGNTLDSRSKFEQDLTKLKQKMTEARTKYFQMEEQARLFAT